MENKIHFSAWTELELETREECRRCFCDCHAHPGTYHTDEDHPCGVCGHVNQEGYFPQGILSGWVAYWRSDKVYVRQ